jgi:hypothetical protein
MLTPVYYTAPTHWACYFINSDPSGLEDDDIAAADAFIDSLDLGIPVDCLEGDFMSYHDAREFYPLAADCSTYVFLKVEADVNLEARP